MAQNGIGYHSQALVQREFQNREQVFNKQLDKLDPVVVKQVKQSVWAVNDKLVEDLVYSRIPMINHKRININSILERQRLNDRKREIEETMRNMKVRYDMLSNKDFEEKMSQLQQRFKDIEKAIYSNPQALEIEQLIGLGKSEQNRKVTTLAEFTSQHKSKEEIQREQKEAQDFIKKIKVQKKEWEKQKKEIREKELLKLKEADEKQQRENEEKDKAIEAERKRRDVRVKQELRERDEYRKKNNQETSIKVKEVLNSKPLFKQIEEQEQEQEKSELEKKKKQLKDIRSFMKPIDPREIESHKQRYLEARRMKDLELQDQRERYLEQIEDKARQDQSNLMKYSMNGRTSPKALLQYEREIQEKEEKEKLKEEERRKINERVQNYSRYVREMYYPKASDQKHEEIENLKQKIHHSVRGNSKQLHSQRTSLANLNSGNGTSQGLKNSQSVSKLRGYGSSAITPKPRSQMHDLNHQKSITDTEGGQKKKYVDWSKFENPLKPKDISLNSQPTKFHDSTVEYLKEQRYRREVEGVNQNNQYIEKALNNPNIQDNERLKMIKSKAHQIEQKAYMNEKVLRNNNDRRIEDEIAVNDMYLDAITAKLKLLDRI